MNTERLFTITKQVGEEISQIELFNKMSQLQTHLQNAINTPNEPTQRTVEDALTKIYKLLAKTPSNEFSPGIRANLQELKINNRITVDQLIGTGLSGQLGNIFKDGYTSVKTLDLLKQLVADIKIFRGALENVTNGFGSFGMTDETLKPGVSIVGITIPRGSIDGSLRELQAEMEFWGQFLTELTEVIEGKVDEHEVYSLYSSGFGIDVIATLNVAAQVSLIITSIIYAFEKIQGFRRLKNQAEDLGIEDKLISQLTEKGTKVMEDKLEKIHGEVFQNCKMDDKGRINELKTAINFRINGIANRLDRGFQFEVRTALPKEADENDQKKEKVVKTLGSIEFKAIEGPRLLELPETDLNNKGQVGKPEKEKIIKSKSKNKVEDKK